MDHFKLANYRTSSVPRLFSYHHTDDCPEHDHDYTELVVVTGGSGVHVTETVRYPLRAGDVFVIHCNSSHSYEEVEHMSVATFMFRYEDLFLNNDDFELLPKFRLLFHYAPQCRTKYKFHQRLFLAGENFLYTQNLITRIDEEQRKKEPGHEALIKALFLELVVFLVRNYQTEYDELHHPLHTLSNVFEYIDLHRFEDIRVKDLAKMAHMSYRNFQRIFRNITGMTPVEYVISRRLQTAAEMLADPRKNISDIAVRCGFSSSNYFTRLFRMKFGVTPKEYRKKCF